MLDVGTPVPTWRRWWMAAVLAIGAGWLGVHVVGQDLSAPLAVLLAGHQRLRPEQVRIGRARLHPLGELDLRWVEVELPGRAVHADRVAVYFDPLRAFSGRLLLRGLGAERLRVQVPGGVMIWAARAAYTVQRDGQSRLQVHGVNTPVLQWWFPVSLDVEHASVDLVHGAPQRLAASGVRLGWSAPGELLAYRDGAGIGFRWALPEAEVAGTVAGHGVEADLSMSRLRLPDVRGPVLDLSSTRISGQLHVSGSTDGDMQARGRVLLADVTVDHPLLAPVPLPDLTLVLEGGLTAAWQAAQREVLLSTQGLSLVLGDARLSMAGDLGVLGPAAYRADLEFVLDDIDCARLLLAMPRPLLPQLEGLGLTGQIGGVLRLTLDSRELPELGFGSDLQVGCQVVSDPPRADVRTLLDRHLSIERPGEDGRPHRLPLSDLAPGADGTPGFQPLSGLPWPITRTFLVAEDNLFFLHHGFDLQMIGRALGTDLQEQRTSRGASTITQQLVKNLWLSQERALSRKMEEAVLTWRLEQVVPKQRILEVYLNLVELGSGIYGIAMASQHYFGLPPQRLSLDQAAQLAALLPAPRRGMDAAWSRRYRDLVHRLSRAPVPRRQLSDADE